MYICMFSIKLEICERIVEMEKKLKKTVSTQRLQASNSAADSTKSYNWSYPAPVEIPSKISQSQIWSAPKLSALLLVRHPNPSQNVVSISHQLLNYQ